MNRRTTPAAKRDDDTFPIRVKLAIPPNGLGPLADELHGWLRDNLPRDAWAAHTGRTIGGSAMAVHFVRIEDANRFLVAFPGCELARASCLVDRTHRKAG